MIITGTGHRPDKLGGYSPHVRERLTDMARAWLSRQPDRPIIISGMALGWDTALALAAVDLEFELWAAIPFKGQESKWRQEDKDRYHQILAYASKVEIVCEGGYAAWKMNKRNEWMVDHCDRLLALYDGGSGGTANCVEYAVSKGVPIKNLWNMWIKYSGVTI